MKPAATKVSDATDAELERKCKDAGISRSEFVRRAIEAALGINDKELPAPTAKVCRCPFCDFFVANTIEGWSDLRVHGSIKHRKQWVGGLGY